MWHDLLEELTEDEEERKDGKELGLHRLECVLRGKERATNEEGVGDTQEGLGTDVCSNRLARELRSSNRRHSQTGERQYC